MDDVAVIPAAPQHPRHGAHPALQQQAALDERAAEDNAQPFEQEHNHRPRGMQVQSAILPICLRVCSANTKVCQHCRMCFVIFTRSRIRHVSLALNIRVFDCIEHLSCLFCSPQPTADDPDFIETSTL